MRTARLWLKLAFSAALTLGLLEAALWLFQPLPLFPEEWQCVYDQNLPGLKTRVVYERNRFGLRSVTMAHAQSTRKPSKTVRVVCLGASTTDLPTQNAEDAWWGVLESLLAEPLRARGLRLEVWARGRGGEVAADALRWARSGLAACDPDAVVLLEGVNDLCWNGGPGYAHTPGRDVSRGVPEREWHLYPKWKRALRRVSQIYRHVSELRNRRRVRESLRAGAALEWHSGALPDLRILHQGRPCRATLDRSPDPIVEFGESMTNLLAFLRERGIPTVVCSQPVLWRSNMTAEAAAQLWMPVSTPSGFARAGSSWLEAEMARYNAVQRRAAAGAGAGFVDLAARVPATTEMFFDDCHFTDAGNRRVAEEIYPALRAQLEGRKPAAATSR